MRLFLAIKIPDQIQDKISSLYIQEEQGIRWTPAHQLHLTLIFIGDQPQEKIDEISEAIAEIEFNTMPINLSKTGFFKSGIYWIGVEETNALMNLQKKLYRAIANLGIHIENRRFKPHITIARDRGISAPLAQSIERKGLGFAASFTASSFELMSSYLKPNGPEYQTEVEFIP